MGIIIYDEDEDNREKIRNLIRECFDLHGISDQIITFDSDIQILKVCNFLAKNSDLLSRETLDSILKNADMKDSVIYFKFSGKEILLNLKELEYIESCKHRLFFYMQGNIAVRQMYGKLDFVEKRIKKYGFVRIHQSYLVNSKYVMTCERYKLSLQSGKILPITKAKYAEIVGRIFNEADVI